MLFWVLVGLAVLLAVVGMVLQLRSARRQAERVGFGEPTGVVVAPPLTPPSRRLPTWWSGGGEFHGRGHRVSATTPLAVLALDSGSLSIGVRPALLGRLFGVRGFAGGPSDVAELAPVVTGRMPSSGLLGAHGLGIQPADGSPPAFFWCSQSTRSEILQLASTAGFPVRWDERRKPLW